MAAPAETLHLYVDGEAQQATPGTTAAELFADGGAGLARDATL